MSSSSRNSALAAAANGFVTSSPTHPARTSDTRAFAIGRKSRETKGLPQWRPGTLILGTGIGELILLIACLCWICHRRRNRRRFELESFSSQGSRDTASARPPLVASPGVQLRLPQNAFTYEELKRATNNFSNTNVVGHGGFGYVYKGVLPDGKIVAIKQLRAGSNQGEREFQSEVEIISRIHHRHLVSLVGYCASGAKRILVYEYVPNGTLESHLHGNDHPTMAWPMRMKAAIGSAKGLGYLHAGCNPKIIHRDVKASNILLDFQYDAKVADFGLAKLASDVDSHVSTRVMGTFGYLDPEYASRGRVTEKSDVYSFGVVLLELITGRRPIDRSRASDEGIVHWAKPLLMQALKDGKYDAIIDPRLHNSYDTEEMTRMLACAGACISRSAQHRPMMIQVIGALEGHLALSDLNEGTGADGGCESSGGLRQFLMALESQDQEDSKKFRMMALESQEQATSVSGPSDEYGPPPFRLKQWRTTDYPGHGPGDNPRGWSSR